MAAAVAHQKCCVCKTHTPGSESQIYVCPVTHEFVHVACLYAATGTDSTPTLLWWYYHHADHGALFPQADFGATVYRPPLAIAVRAYLLHALGVVTHEHALTPRNCIR